MARETLTPGDIVRKTEYWSQLLSESEGNKPELAYQDLYTLIKDIVRIRRTVGLNDPVDSDITEMHSTDLVMQLSLGEQNPDPVAHIMSWDPRVNQDDILAEVWDFKPNSSNGLDQAQVGASYVSPLLKERVHGIAIPRTNMKISYADRTLIARTAWRMHLENDAPMIDHAQAFFAAVAQT